MHLTGIKESSMTDDDDRPLIGKHPYRSAAREAAHPSPTSDPQVVGDLDRLQLAERELGASLAAVRQILPSAEEDSRAHGQRAAELGRLIGGLGGAPSESGLRELPHEAEQMAGIADPRALFVALAANAAALVELYTQAQAHVMQAELAGPVEQLLEATRSEAARYEAEARRLAASD
jgi:hypothetical protein